MSFLILGCTEDSFLETYDQESTKNKEYLLTRVSNLEIASNTSLTNKLRKIKQGPKFKNTNSIDGNVSFDLNMSEAAYIESHDGLVHSYTFSINNINNSNDINNIILVSYNDQDYDAYLTTYTLTV